MSKREPKTLWRGNANDLITPAPAVGQEPAGTGETADPPPHGRFLDEGVDAWEAEMKMRQIMQELPMLPGDREFVDHQVRFLCADLRVKALALYYCMFRRGMTVCPDPVRRENAGRRRANAFLRRWVARTVTRHRD